MTSSPLPDHLPRPTHQCSPSLCRELGEEGNEFPHLSAHGRVHVAITLRGH